MGISYTKIVAFWLADYDSMVIILKILIHDGRLKMADVEFSTFLDRTKGLI